MKKFLCMAMTCVLFLLSACTGEVDYVTKYIANCEKTEFRQDAANGSTVLYELSAGEVVSFEKNAENGYAKVVHEGVTGYVLSACLEDKKPESDVKPVENTQEETTNKYDYLISDMSEKDIEEYISEFVRPLYNEINAALKDYEKSTAGSATLWHDERGCAKKELMEGADSYNMSRQYYYNTYTGKMVFAFVFKGSEEYRLYFEKDKLVRYIDEAGNIVNNPASEKALKMAEHAMKEAY